MLPCMSSTVPFTQLRHNNLPAYVAEGYGGKEIEAWPVYDFFVEYLSGDMGGATEAYVAWYMEQLASYADVPKSQGGMLHGSLFTLIERETGKSFSETTVAEREAVVRVRVKQRFALLTRIVGEGYRVEKGDRIEAVRNGKYVYLKGGHHRAAALRALGEEDMPGLFVFPHPIVYALYSILRNIKYGISK